MGERRPAPGRPRSDEASARILRATVELLAESGAAGVSVDAVAGRAGVSRPTVYRRWKDRTELIAAAVRDAFARTNPEAPHTADLRADLVTVLSNTMRLLTGTELGRVIAGLVSELPRSPELAAALREVERDRREVLRQVLRRAQEQNLLRSADVELAVDLLLGPAYFRLLITGDPVSPELAVELAEVVVAPPYPE
ncbi:TetR/AcrR family transcriptional regulator [Streptomyces actuosus]|uniref:TetR/AcrR family transcriptional regulator n=1 Tax=Streptomyces actuosus TaxID=1885 RepID=A0ABS2VJH4_STRAS|nr:TetR/AcrR family transcriptional regulator [Streptomyces actuosus]MBN0043238.1 TetR/AcrR family transcriptional regulator [Streptomyces actuosus]